MLKGIDVTLYTKRQTGEDAFGASVYEETPEVVRNVLIGAPETADIVSEQQLYGRQLAYTLAFQQLMEEQRVRARKAREALGDLGWAGIEFGKDMPETKFLGYTQNTAEGKVLALVSEDEMQDTIGAGDSASFRSFDAWRSPFSVSSRSAAAFSSNTAVVAAEQKP